MASILTGFSMRRTIWKESNRGYLETIQASAGLPGGNMDDFEAAHPSRSTFVTALAWIFIVLAGFSSVISVLQNIMIAVMFHPDKMARGMDQPKEFDKMPAFFKAFSAHPQYFFLASFVLFVLVLIVSLGLLKR